MILDERLLPSAILTIVWRTPVRQSRIDSLKRQHNEIERKISEILKQPKPDGKMLAELKKEKLKIKDEIGSSV